MSRRNSVNLIVVSAIALIVSACGTSPSAPITQLHRAAATVVSAQGVPPASAFVTVQCTVSQLLPDSHNPNNNLDHQNFVVKTTDGQTLFVNNDTTTGIGTKVAGIAVGEALSIRGVEYHDVNPTKDGIHWTHHNVKPNDAGFIKTPDGHVFQ